MGNHWCPSTTVHWDTAILLQPCRDDWLFLSRQGSALEGHFLHLENYCLPSSRPWMYKHHLAASEDPGIYYKKKKKKQKEHSGLLLSWKCYRQKSKQEQIKVFNPEVECSDFYREATRDSERAAEPAPVQLAVSSKSSRRSLLIC